MKFVINIIRAGMLFFKYSIWEDGLLSLYYKICIRCKFVWYNLWIRKNEFHKSLNIDSETIYYGSEKFKEKYMKNLLKRRQAAHDGDLEKRKNKRDLKPLQ